MKKALIFTGIILAVIVSCLLWRFVSNHQNNDSTIDKSSKSYSMGYDEMNKSLTKNGLRYNYPPLAEEYGAPTIELILAKDYGYRGLRFPCVGQDQNYNWGLVDAYLDYVKAKYGNDFQDKAKLKSEAIEDEFNIKYYKSNVEKLAKENFKKYWTKDSIENAELDLKWIYNTPFTIQFDTIYNKDWTKVIVSDSMLFFNAMAPSYMNKTAIDLPAISFVISWKPESKFPFKDIPFCRIYLNIQE